MVQDSFLAIRDGCNRNNPQKLGQVELQHTRVRRALAVVREDEQSPVVDCNLAVLKLLRAALDKREVATERIGQDGVATGIIEDLKHDGAGFVDSAVLADKFVDSLLGAVASGAVLEGSGHCG